jgi:hypothetical protein
MGVVGGLTLADLVGGLFAGGTAEAAAGAAGAELGLGAADLGLGLGAADVGASLGAGAEAGLGAADIAGAGIGAADVAGAADAAGAGLAADAAAGAGAGIADLAGAGADVAATAPDIADTLAAAGGGLGDQVGAQGALSFAPTATDTAAPAASGGNALDAINSAIAKAPSAATVSAGDPLATAASGGGSPALEAEIAPDAADTATSQLSSFAGKDITPTPTGFPGQAQPGAVADPFSPVGSDTSAALSNASFPSPAATPTAAAAPAAAAPAAGGGGITDTLSKALDSPYTRLAELGLPLGMLGYNAIKGPAPIPPQAQLAEQNAANQLLPLQGKATANTDLFNTTAATDLNLANSFQISPAQMATINTWKQNQYNQLYQQIANQNPGGGDPTSSSQWIQGKNQIDQQALAQQTQMINQLIQTAFQANTAANQDISTSSGVTQQLDSVLMQAAQLQVQQDTTFQNALGQAMNSFGLLAGLSGKFGSTSKATP